MNCGGRSPDLVRSNGQELVANLERATDLLEQPCILDRQGRAPPDLFEELHVALRERAVRSGWEHHRSENAALGSQRDADPGDGVCSTNDRVSPQHAGRYLGREATVGLVRDGRQAPEHALVDEIDRALSCDARYCEVRDGIE